MNAIVTPGFDSTAASRQWASRPSDERFTSLDDLLAHAKRVKDHSHARSVSVRGLEARPVEGDHKGLAIVGKLPGDQEVALPTHWSFGQLAQRAEAPAGYLRKLPNFLTADLLNWGLKNRPVEEVGLMVNDAKGAAQYELAAATGPNYGRIWNEQIITALVERFGDGITGRFRVPGEFGKAIQVTKDNTTLYAGDRDMFVFLADEENRIEVPNRRNGQPGSLARGFFAWNSEVGSATMGVAAFLFDYVCCNRMVWGGEQGQTLTIRHTSGAPDKFLEEATPALIAMADSSTHSIEAAIAAARQRRVDDVDDFLATRFTTTTARAIKLVHEAEEGRPIETLYDVTVGATAYAKGIQWQDERVGIERVAGKLLASAA